MCSSLSIVIPCYNEEENIAELIDGCNKVISRSDVEFILVNNGSQDRTYQELLAHTENLGSKIIIINLKKNLGYGGGILAGLQKATGKYIGWTHADLQTDLGDILKAKDLLGKNIFIKGRRVGRKFSENFFSYGMSIFESIILGTFMYEINAQPTIFERKFFESWHNPPQDFSLDLYAYFKAKQNQISIKRIRVLFPSRKFGQSAWNTDLKSKLSLIGRTMHYSFKLRKNFKKF